MLASADKAKLILAYDVRLIAPPYVENRHNCRISELKA